jgi:hypothetical protein
MCTVIQVCLQNHLKKGFFLSNMQKRITIIHYAKFHCSKMKIGTSYNSWALVYFHSAFLFSKCFHIFKALLYFFQSAFIFLSKRFYFLSKRFYLNFLNVSQRLFIFSMCESALFIFSYSKTLFSSCFYFWM